MPSCWPVTIVVVVLVFLDLTSVPARSADRVRFNEQIRPLLSDRCFACHGPDAKRREADLRLDQREDALGQAAIIPHKSGESALWRRITTSDPDRQMPPPSAKKPGFTAEELELIRRWIDEGAEYEGHWAFLPIKKAIPPQAFGAGNPIDAFIRDRLAQAGLSPSARAEKSTLLRRVSIDLIGLLPSADEVDEFLADDDPSAYERLVDRLLASPHYGERWGRHWLDQARYADSNGYAVDAPREMWPYRDWVIESLNRDLPFDQFTREQLAGDLLPNPSKSQLIATAFHRNTLINQEGGSDREQFRVEAAMDRVSTTGAVWLGLTVGCAQCHTHKFDPITQREYYQLMAFYNSSEDANDKGPTVDVRRGEVFGAPAPLSGETPSPSQEDFDKLRNEWERTTRERLEAASAGPQKEPEWHPLNYEKISTVSKTGGLQRLDDNSLLYDRRGSANDRFVIEGSTDLPKVAAIRLRVLTHESLPRQGPGTAGNGNFVLTDFIVRAGQEKQALIRATADHEQPSYPVRFAIDDSPSSGWAINVGPASTARMNANHEAVFVLNRSLESNPQRLTVELAHDLNEHYLIGRFAIDVAATPSNAISPEDVRLLAILRKPPEQRSNQDSATIQSTFKRSQASAETSRKDPNPKLAQLMIMRDLRQPRETFLLTRGDFTRPDKSTGPLTADVLSAVRPALKKSAARPNRLDLANWLIDPENPLTGRVTVNRVWMRFFGRGLVETEEDFGTQGTPPINPALLDWMSREFQDKGYRIKSLHRLIVCSETYRQSSKERADLSERDSRNLLLGRQQRLRLDAEITRDAALSASGLLESSLGGPSVYPPQPDGVYAFTQVNKSWPTETGAQRYRRTLYTFFYRSAPYPLLTTFDSPDFQTACTRRLRSNTPLQALTLSNDPMFLELAQGLALRLVTERPGPFEEALEGRITRGGLLCFGRQPTRAESQILIQLVKTSAADFSLDHDAANKLTTTALRGHMASPQAASLVILARALLNTDNFLTRE